MEKKNLFDMSTESCTECLDKLFSELPVNDLELIRSHIKTMEFSRADRIFNEDEKPFGMFFVVKGKVKLFKTGDEGKEQIVRFANEGDIIGYRSLLGNDEYRCSASAIESTLICQIPKNVINDVFDRNMFMYKKFIQLLSRDLRQAEVTLTEMAQKPVRERVAECICNLKLTYGEDESGYVNVRLTREEMANIVGTATETVIRLLGEFKKDKYIDFKLRRIKILDEIKLKKVAGYI